MKPETEEALAERIAGAAEPLWIRGGGTRGVDLPPGAAMLETGALSGITLYEPGALTLVARAGTPLAEIETTLAGEGQRLGFEPMDARGLTGAAGASTIGGVVAANVSGPRRIQVGACRDFLLGVRFVDGAGRVLKNGGRVMKNVTGYDLVKLMAGSWGTLGVLTEVSLKVLPAPEAVATVVLHGLADAAAVEAMSQALGSPFEVSGAAHIPAVPGTQAQTLLRVEGLAGSVAYRAGRLKELLAGAVAEITVEADAGRCAQLWAVVRDAGPMQGGAGDVWRVSLKPSDGPEFVNTLRRSRPDLKVMYDWGGGLVWVQTAPGDDIRSDALLGHATLMRAGVETRKALARFQPETPGVAALARGLRHRFDPRGILNPGLMER